MDMNTRHLESEAKALSGEVFGAMINLSGRRRFTSQRIVLYAVLASQGQDGAEAIAREALALFRGAHKALLADADGLPGVFCAELREAYFGKLAGDREIVAFAEQADRTLAAIASPHDKGAAAGLLAELVRLTTPTLAILNQITSVYEEQAKLHARLMKKQLRGVITDIEKINKQARMVAFNARVVAARAGQAGREFAVVAGVLSGITDEIDQMVNTALAAAA
ncbi:chemotaxis protein [Duganella sp. Leaf61]|uniref:methyl-accepting chemotaxis protein n=1 Tax=Duganella sp. Leaf61 TaxID=1736227 RepID=UPI0006F5B625|nr:methyl-accepting chemotaxis protein [Duganella sp. Leaf61]KQN79518.1 chemotaxis protein [Duganella sp. Leaf61]